MTKKRLFSFYLLVIIAMFLLFIRLGYLKTLTNEEYFSKAFEQWTRSAPVEARRGNIYDRNGKIIVGSYLAPTVVTIPRQVINKNETAVQLARILHCPTSSILAHLNKKVSVEIIKPEGKKITTEEAYEIANLALPGIYIVGDTVRSYPYGDLLAQVIGICGIDNQGITGLEYIYDSYLRGSSGAVQIFTDAHGNLIENLTGGYTSATSGFDLYLTIDLDMQVSLERVLENAQKRYNTDQIMGLVMNVKTSEILAMASMPNFDPANYQDYSQELYNRNLPIWMSFEPGSTFKIATFAIGLEEKVFTLDETFIDPGYSIVDGVRMRDWKAGGHGQETFLEVLQNSCNPGFVEIGLRIGKERFFDYLAKLGFGQKTQIDLLGESTGIIFNPDLINNVELATSSFGQGISVTPIQLVNAAAAIVNGGVLHQPYILKAIGEADSNTLIYQQSPIVVDRVISEDTSAKVASALEHVVALGTGRSAYIEDYRVGGKTGSAQIAENGVYVDDRYILSFLGIAPMNDPELAVYIAVVNPKNTIQYGGVVAAPLVKEVLSECLPIANISKQAGGIPLDVRYWQDTATHQVANYLGLDVGKIPANPYYQIKVIGSGKTVVAQMPEPGEKLIEGGYVSIITE